MNKAMVGPANAKGIIALEIATRKPFSQGETDAGHR
jgi:hypothetical protein